MSTALQYDDDATEGPIGSSSSAPALVSLHFIRSALRRKRVLLGLISLLGFVLGALYLVAVPPTHTADASIVLAHDPDSDPDRAMATDLSLATTRAVAQQVIARTGLNETPVGFLGRVTVVQTTTDILTVSLSAASDEEAIRELSAYTSAFLAFRGGQLTRQNELLSQGSNSQIDSLQKRVDAVTKRIDAASATAPSDDSGVGEMISERAQYLAQISTLQQSVEDSTLKTTSTIAASRLIDAAAVTPKSPLKRMVLVLMTPIVGLGSLGLGLVIVAAIVSDRLRTRLEVATALEVPVPASVGHVKPLPSIVSRLPVLRALNDRRLSDLQRLARVIETAIPESEQGQWLALGCVDNAREMSWGAVAAAVEMGRRGKVVRLVDLTEEGVIDSVADAVLARMPGPRPIVSRPKMAPSLARDPADIVTGGPGTWSIPALQETDIFLTVADLNPAVGAYHLTSWTQRVLVGVTVGRSSAERVRTAADLVRTAGLDLWTAVLLEAEPMDVSSGTPMVPTF